MNSVVLQAKQCRSSQTSELIQTTIREMLEDWKILLSELHVFYLFCVYFEEAAMHIVLFL